MRISDWSSDVCSSDLDQVGDGLGLGQVELAAQEGALAELAWPRAARAQRLATFDQLLQHRAAAVGLQLDHVFAGVAGRRAEIQRDAVVDRRSEEHTSELQSLRRISYAVFCLQKKKNNLQKNKNILTENTNMNIKQT